MVDKKITSLSDTPFDSIRHLDEQGEYWLARELMPLLAYAQWRQFEDVIEKSKIASQNSDIDPLRSFFADDRKK
jgi:DNA-damage-inducible protein D